jgi:hypothetical protein
MAIVDPRSIVTGEGALVATSGGTGVETVIDHGRIVGDFDAGADTFIFLLDGRSADAAESSGRP